MVWAWGLERFRPTRDNRRPLLHADARQRHRRKSVAGGGRASISRWLSPPTARVWTWGINSGRTAGHRLHRHQPSHGRSSDHVWTSRGSPPGSRSPPAVKNDGTVWTWGANDAGQLGDGSTTQRNSPRQVPGLSSITRVDCGYYHTLALGSDGSVWAWGRNSNGQLGDGTTTNRSTAAKIANLAASSSISAGEFHSMALAADGAVWCWGEGDLGQLGTGQVYQYPTRHSSSPRQHQRPDRPLQQRHRHIGRTGVLHGRQKRRAPYGCGEATSCTSLATAAPTTHTCPSRCRGWRESKKIAACHYNAFFIQVIQTPGDVELVGLAGGLGDDPAGQDHDNPEIHGDVHHRQPGVRPRVQQLVGRWQGYLRQCGPRHNHRSCRGGCHLDRQLRHGIVQLVRHQGLGRRRNTASWVTARLSTGLPR